MPYVHPSKLAGLRGVEASQPSIWALVLKPASGIYIGLSIWPPQVRSRASTCSWSLSLNATSFLLLSIYCLPGFPGLEQKMTTHSSTLAWKIPWSLVGYRPWGHKESDTTVQLHFHFSLSCTGEANGNPLQCSCLENPRDGGVWWAVIYGVAQSRTRLKRLSSSNSSRFPRWLSGKEPTWNAGDSSSIPGSGRSPGEGSGNTLQYSYLENPMDRGAWWARVRGVAKSRTWLVSKQQQASLQIPFSINCNPMRKRLLFLFWWCLVAKLYLTPGTSWTAVHQVPLVHGILQARMAGEWLFPCHFLLQGILPTQGSNLGLLGYSWSPALQADSLLTEPPGKPFFLFHRYINLPKITELIGGKAGIWSGRLIPEPTLLTSLPRAFLSMVVETSKWAKDMSNILYPLSLLLQGAGRETDGPKGGCSHRNPPAPNRNVWVCCLTLN